MAEISREDAIICFKDMLCERCSLKDAGIDRCCELAEKKAISDMEKLEKIEQIVNFVRDNESILFDDDIAENLFKIEQIVKGE